MPDSFYSKDQSLIPVAQAIHCPQTIQCVSVYRMKLNTYLTSMKPLLAAIALISLLTSNCAAQSGSAFGRKHYPIKSCRIVLRFINGSESGTKTVIFDDWGNKEKEEGVTMFDTSAMKNSLTALRDSLRNRGAPAFPDSFQFSAIQHNLIITVEGQRYIVDLDRHTGEKGPILLMGGSFEENMKQMGFAFIRTDTLLEKPCKVWEQAAAVRLWVWNNYVVKKQMIIGLPAGMRIEEYATEIDESYSIKPDEFKIPDNIQFQ